jgi:hypothetical protein
VLDPRHQGSQEYAAPQLTLESLCQRKPTALDDLKKSLLHKVFAGELEAA